MDVDPELAVTLTNGRRVLTFAITQRGECTWQVRAPGFAQLVTTATTALALRERLDRQIARQLAAGWIPAEPTSIVPVSSDLALQIAALLEALARARTAIRAADPTEALLRASDLLRVEARRIGIDASNAWILRARDYRRLGELAEQRGDLAAALFFFRTALAASPRVGVARRCARLARYLEDSPALSDGCVHIDHRHGESRARPGGERVAGRCLADDATRRQSRRPAPRGDARHPKSRDVHTRGDIVPMLRIQIVGRIPAALHRRVRAAAARRQQSLNALLIDALTRAVTRTRPRA